MKKPFLFISLLICMANFVNGQNQIDRNLVVIEIATGTWCGYCPGAAMGADDMVHNGHKVAILENHDGDAFSNPYSDSRNSYYGVGGFPSTWFDGKDHIRGGNATMSMYSSYLNKYNARMAEKTSFDIDMSFTHTGLDYDVEVTIKRVAPYGNLTNLVAHLAITESRIPKNWHNNLTEVNFVNQLMVPNQNGTLLDFSNQDSITLNLSFSASGNWNIDECEMVAFIQDLSSKEILNGDRRSMATVSLNHDAMVSGIISPREDTYCESRPFDPEISIRNRGQQDLTSVEIEYWYNNEPKNTYNWTGSLPFNQRENIILPSVPFTTLTFNRLRVRVKNPNGQVDEQPGNDYYEKVFERPIDAQGGYQFVVKPDMKGSELNWYIYDWSNGTIPAQGGPYTDGNTAPITQNFTLSKDGCFSLVMKDAGGEGLCNSASPGYMAIIGPTRDTILKRCFFADASFFHFSVGTPPTAIDHPMELSDVSVYPNPTEGLTKVSLYLEEPVEVTLSVFQINGQQIIQTTPDINAGSFEHTLDMKGHAKGIYLLKVQAGDQVITKKIMVE